MSRWIPCLVASVGLLAGAACDSDYSLGQDTPTSLPLASDTPSPTATATLTPLGFSPTPTATLGTPEPGDFEALLRVEPPSLVFGPLMPGCGDSADLLVINDGDVPVEVTNVRLSADATVVTLTLSDDLSVLDPGEEGHIHIEATAVTLGTSKIGLQIDASAGPAAWVPIQSEVVEGITEVVDTFYQVPENDVDVLWVIDNSGSMSDNQKRLASNFDAFMDNFIPLGIQYHMGVVTTDMLDPSQSGRMQGDFGESGQHFIDWTMQEAGDDAFRETIKRIGDDGSGAEQGLIAMESALEPPLSVTWNIDFLRPDAFLSVIIVSDEMDQSPPDPVTGAYEQRYIDFLYALKGDPENVVVSTIISYVEYQGYLVVATETGGVVASINDPDYYQILLEVGWISAGYQSQFELTEIPVRSQDIRVEVNGLEWPPGATTWVYDADRQVIVFAESAIPADGARIDVFYKVEVTCADLTEDTP